MTSPSTATLLASSDTWHAPREDWTKPMTAGALARWVLWNRETLRESVADYLRRFDLTLG